MGLHATVLMYRDTPHGPEAVVFVEVAKKGGHPGLYFVQRSLLHDDFAEYQILTFEERESAEACFSGSDHSQPAHEVTVVDKTFLEVIECSIGSPAGKPPGKIVVLPERSEVYAWFFSSVRQREPVILPISY